MTKEIVQDGHPVLRGKSKEIPQDDIQSDRIQSVISDMKEALSTQKDGVAIAAPQIGEPLRIFVIAGKIFKNEKIKSIVEVPDLVFINPKVTTGDTKGFLEEGCLSVRGVYGEVQRAEKASITALDAEGEKVSMEAEGLLAQIFQHEADHLNGILFIDKAKNLKNADPEKKGRNKNLEERLPETQ